MKFNYNKKKGVGLFLYNHSYITVLNAFLRILYSYILIE